MAGLWSATSAIAAMLSSATLAQTPQEMAEYRRKLAEYNAVRQPFDAQFVDTLELGRREQRVAALRLVTVVGGEPQVQVLAGPRRMPDLRPQDDAPDARGQGLERLDARPRLRIIDTRTVGGDLRLTLRPQ